MNLALRIGGVVGSFNHPSGTCSLVENIVQQAGQLYGLESSIVTLSDLDPSLGNARTPQEHDTTAQAAISRIIDADLLVVGVPTYNGAYPGMFKHFFDLLSPDALVGKPVILAATSAPGNGGRGKRSGAIRRANEQSVSVIRVRPDNIE